MLRAFQSKASQAYKYLQNITYGFTKVGVVETYLLPQAMRGRKTNLLVRIPFNVIEDLLIVLDPDTLHDFLRFEEPGARSEVFALVGRLAGEHNLFAQDSVNAERTTLKAVLYNPEDRRAFYAHVLKQGNPAIDIFQGKVDTATGAMHLVNQLLGEFLYATGECSPASLSDLMAFFDSQAPHAVAGTLSVSALHALVRDFNAFSQKVLKNRSERFDDPTFYLHRIANAHASTTEGFSHQDTHPAGQLVALSNITKLTAWLMAILASNPALADAIRKEHQQKRAGDQTEQNSITPADFPLSIALFHRMLAYYMPAAILGRRSHTPKQLGKQQLTRQTLCIYPARAVMRQALSEHYHLPPGEVPDDFFTNLLDANGQDMLPFEINKGPFLPFGGGRRPCPTQSGFADVFFLLLMRLLSQYDLSPTSALPKGYLEQPWLQLHNTIAPHMLTITPHSSPSVDPTTKSATWTPQQHCTTSTPPVKGDTPAPGHAPDGTSMEDRSADALKV